MERIADAFAGLNTVNGYEPMLEYLLRPVKRVYILKGSPGCGKSTIMKRLAAYARSKGEPVNAVRCSSDPDSYDAVIFPGTGAAIADGTAPHVLEAKEYGVREQIVSLEKSFDYDKLDFYAYKLNALFNEKSVLTARAYDMLAAAGPVERARASLAAQAFLHDKAEKFCAGFIRRVCRAGGKGRVNIVPSDTFCRRGFVTTGAYSDAGTIYLIKDCEGTGEELLSMLYAGSVLEEADMRIIPCPVDGGKISGIYYPASDTLIRADRYVPFAAGKTIRAVRFCDTASLSACRGKLRALGKLRAGLLDEAREAFEEAYRIHCEIEAVYSQAVDFEVTDSITAELRENIFRS